VVPDLPDRVVVAQVASGEVHRVVLVEVVRAARVVVVRAAPVGAEPVSVVHRARSRAPDDAKTLMKCCHRR
jgi:hypothetical protein